jgi:uncharacterized protein YgiB involved in biofilm formation
MASEEKMIESNDKHVAQAGSEKPQGSTSLASEVYQWGTHKVDDAKTWAKAHPTMTTAAEVTALAAGAGVVFLATKGHGGQQLAREAAEEASALGAKSMTDAAVRDSGSALAHTAVGDLERTGLSSVRALAHGTEHEAAALATKGLPNAQSIAALESAGTKSVPAVLSTVDANAATAANSMPAVLNAVDTGAVKAATTLPGATSALDAGVARTATTLGSTAETTAANAAAKAAETERTFLGLSIPKWGAPVLTMAGLGGATLALAGCDKTPDDGSNNTTNIDKPGQTSDTPTNPEDEKPEQAKVYHDAAECTKDGVYTKNFCETEFANAQKTHMSIAPKFETKEQCEEETGTKCEAGPAPDANALAANPSAGGNSDATAPAPGASGAQQVGQPGDATVQNGQTTVIVQQPHSSFFMPYMYGYMMGQNSSSTYVSRPLYSSPSGSSFITPEGRNIGTRTGSVEVPAASMSRATVGVGEGNASVSRGGFGARSGASGFGG